MTLASGDRLGPYEIESSIGSGGMGEVYRARDTRLHRTVAIKVLRDELSSSSELHRRFEREARLISQLDHPHICTVFDVGQNHGVNYLVMEYMEGKSLAQRLERGPLRVSEALTVAAQIAAALGAAHREGIIHRDVKPANIMLTKSGAKLMDFGLAKPVYTGALAYAASVEGTTATIAPTTSEGSVVGTFQYMAPEVLRGEPADVRSDIFSFGCVLYEMIAGTPAFSASSRIGVIAAILEKHPEPLIKRQHATSPELAAIVDGCLVKAPGERWQNVLDLIRALAMAERERVIPPQSGLRRPLRWIVGLALVIIIGVFAVLATRRTSSVHPLRRYSIVLPGSAPLAPASLMPLGVGRPNFVVSKDGEKLVYVGLNGATKQLYLRINDGLPPRPLTGTEGAHSPFFSPDARWIGFFAEGKLKKIATSGGPVIALTEAVLGFGGNWAADDNIYFSSGERTPIYRISASGGVPVAVTPSCLEARLVGEYWPQILPSGKGLLLANSRAGIVAFDFASGKFDRLTVSGSSPRWSPTGHILYVDDGLLWALPFDEMTLKKKGPPKLLLDQVQMEQQGAAQFDITEDGSLFYVRGGDVNESSLVWVNSARQIENLGLPPHRFGEFRISPDGKTLVVAINEQTQSDLWTYDLQRKTLSRLTDSGRGRAPLWNLKGDAIVFATYADSTPKLVETSLDGSRTRAIADVPGLLRATWYTPDGEIMLSTYEANAGIVSTLDASGKRREIERSHQMRIFPTVSPDGRWLAYVSDETGRWEVYVRDMAGTRKWRITTDGGEEPIWERGGRNLFYRNGDEWLRVATTSLPDFHAAPPVRVLQGPYVNIPGYSYDVAADGRFLLLQSEYQDKKNYQIEVIENWPALMNKNSSN